MACKEDTEWKLDNRSDRTRDNIEDQDDLERERVDDAQSQTLTDYLTGRESS